MYVRGSLLTIRKSDDVWMFQSLEYIDLGVKILFQLFVEFM